MNELSKPTKNSEEGERLENEIQAQSEFMSIIAHQLKTPLAGTKWSYKMLLDGEFGSLNEQQHAVLLEGSKNNERMISLVDEMRNAGKTRIWSFMYHMSDIDLPLLIKDTIDEFLPLAKNKHIPISIKIEGTPHPINADQAKIRIVIENILDNALKYSPDDEGHEITIQLVFHDTHVAFTIHNDGTTIMPDEVGTIFEKYTRGSLIKKSSIGGTGLGLFTARRIIRDHQGTLTFTSSAHEGTTLTGTLPFAHKEQNSVQ
jgi:signal transduction histidine kinase